MVVDLFYLLNEGGTIKNMMPNNYDFKQFQVSVYATSPVYPVTSIALLGKAERRLGSNDGSFIWRSYHIAIPL